MLDQKSREVDRGERTARVDEALYTRPMPGGGYVKVELVVGERGASERRRGRIVIEERAVSRHVGARPIVVEELEGDDENELLERLFRIACDNAALARRVLRRRSSALRAD